MAQGLDRMSMIVMKWASSPCSNPFLTYVKDILSQSAKKNTVTELQCLIIAIVFELIYT